MPAWPVFFDRIFASGRVGVFPVQTQADQAEANKQHAPGFELRHRGGDRSYGVYAAVVTRGVAAYLQRVISGCEVGARGKGQLIRIASSLREGDVEGADTIENLGAEAIHIENVHG